jgi:predicted nucleic acid-binding protein
MRVVLDCNVLVMCLTSKSPYHKIYQGLTNQNIDLLVSHDILMEYEENHNIKI